MSNQDRRMVLYQPQGVYNWAGYQSPRAETVTSEVTEEIGRGNGGASPLDHLRNWNNWNDPWQGDDDFEFFGPRTQHDNMKWYNSAMEGDPMFGDPGFPFEEGPMGDERRARGPSRAAGRGEEQFDSRDPYRFFAEGVDPFDPYGLFDDPFGTDPMMDPFGMGDPFVGGFDPFMPGGPRVGRFDPFMPPGGGFPPFGGIDPFFDDPFSMGGGPYGDPFGPAFGDPFGGGFPGFGGMFDDPLFASSLGGGFGYGGGFGMEDPFRGMMGRSPFDDPFLRGGGGGMGATFDDPFAGRGFDPFLGGGGGGGPFGGLPPRRFEDFGSFDPAGAFGGFSPFERPSPFGQLRPHHHHHHHQEPIGPFGGENRPHHHHNHQEPIGPFGGENRPHHHHHNHQEPIGPFGGERRPHHHHHHHGYERKQVFRGFDRD